MDIIDAFFIPLFPIDTFLKLAVAHDRLVIDAIMYLTLVQEMEFIDAFVIHVFAINIFTKKVVAHDRFVWMLLLY